MRARARTHTSAKGKGGSRERTSRGRTQIARARRRTWGRREERGGMGLIAGRERQGRLLTCKGGNVRFAKAKAVGRGSRAPRYLSRLG